MTLWWVNPDGTLEICTDDLGSGPSGTTKVTTPPKGASGKAIWDFENSRWNAASTPAKTKIPFDNLEDRLTSQEWDAFLTQLVSDGVITEARKTAILTS